MSPTAALRVRYPHPTRLDAVSHQTPGAYCVGGALCDAFGIRCDLPGFPTTGELTRALHTANPALPYPRAHYLGEQIIFYNDLRLFEYAWHYAELALAYQTKGDP